MLYEMIACSMFMLFIVHDGCHLSKVISGFQAVGVQYVLIKHTVFDLITAPALITAPLTFYFIFTYHRRLDDLFLDCLPYFHLLTPT